MNNYEIVRGFIESPRFHKRWFELGFTEEDYKGRERKSHKRRKKSDQKSDEGAGARIIRRKKK